ncbi:MAG TPA: PQQ-binding-like beta-propeller repeat protein [Frankiaceae bacterium]|nr:PQQ-binding-like beta-propeller repeat protein [Frankiaceae bacterium]
MPRRRVMRPSAILALLTLLILAACNWPTYHANGGRTGLLGSASSARSLTPAWSHTLDGAVYASPIVNNGTVYVATEGGSVYAFTASGALRWRAHIASPVRLTDLAARGAPCGNIDPLGITGTPVYDAATNRVFAVAETLVNGAVQHVLASINADTGAFATRRVIPPRGNEAAHQERGALALDGSRVIVPFGGLGGDCGSYIGSVVSTATNLAGAQTSYAIPTTREAGMWTPPGPTVLADGSILVADGNGESTSGAYDGSDSVVRLSAGLTFLDRFAPTTWAADNAADLDLGSAGPAVTSNGYVVQSGKRGIVYVLRLSHLGGIGGQVSSASGCDAYGGAAVSGSTVFLPCNAGVRRADIGANGSIRLSWQATGIPGAPVVYGNAVLATSKATGRLYILDPTTGGVRTSMAVGPLTRFATPALDTGRAYVGNMAGIVAVNVR